MGDRADEAGDGLGVGADEGDPHRPDHLVAQFFGGFVLRRGRGRHRTFGADLVSQFFERRFAGHMLVRAVCTSA